MLSVLRMRTVLGLGLVVACAAGARSAPQPTPCPDFNVDTAGWVERRTFAVGATLHLPPQYEHKVFGQAIGEPPKAQADFWALPGSVTLMRTTPDSAKRFSPFQPSPTRCALRGPFGTADVSLQERVVPIGGGRTGPQFTIVTQLTTGSDDKVVLFAGVAMDSASFRQQLAALRTLTLRPR